MNKPHVTKLLKILDKPALLKWANKIGLQGIELDQYRNKKMGQGSLLHKQIEDFVLNDTPFENNIIQKIFIDKVYSKVEFLEIEQSMETEYFTGRIDAKILLNGEKYIIDWKKQKKVYFENILQLVAYRMSDPECKLAVITIPDFTIKPLNITDYEPYEEILKALCLIYHNRKLVDKYF